ncbi:MAG: hypothetical protein SXG53_27185, partial [Pseudomonadota bacterium]|nr:hypothetical protein [Pseudomonadota bacterium]
MDLRARKKYVRTAMPVGLSLLAAAISQQAMAIEIDGEPYATLAAALTAAGADDIITIQTTDTGEIAVTAAQIHGKQINFESGSTAKLKIDVAYPQLSASQQT